LSMLMSSRHLVFSVLTFSVLTVLWVWCVSVRESVCVCVCASVLSASLSICVCVPHSCMSEGRIVACLKGLYSLSLSLRVCLPSPTYIYTHTHTHIYTYIYIYLYIYIFTYLHIYMSVMSVSPSLSSPVLCFLDPPHTLFVPPAVYGNLKPQVTFFSKTFVHHFLCMKCTYGV
jgi:hypothetical protein